MSFVAQLSQVVVGVFMGKYHLTLPKTGATVNEIDEVKNLEFNSDSSKEEEESIMGAKPSALYVSQNHVLSDKEALCACATNVIIGRGPATC